MKRFLLANLILAGCSEAPRTMVPPSELPPIQMENPAPPPNMVPPVDVTPKALTLGTISPNSGLTSGGFEVTITGSGFDSKTQFSLDNVPLIDVRIISDTQAKGFVAKSLGSFGKVALRATRGSDVATKADVFNFIPSKLQFKPRISLKTQRSHLYQLAIADFNGDGKPDIATDSHNSQVGVIFLNTSTGLVPSFRTPMYTPGIQAGHAIGISAGDFNGDGKQDLVINQHENQHINMMRGNGDGTFVHQQRLYYGGYYYAYHNAVGDMNGDNRPDVVVQSCYSNCGVHVFLSDANGNFSHRSYLGTPCHAETITLADFDSDGKLDVVMPYSNSSYMLSVYRGNGDGTFNGTRYDFNQGPGQFNVAVGDLNGDNKPDIVAANHNNINENTLSVLINSSAGAGNINFQAPVYYPAGSRPYGAFVADLNGDGKLDAGVGNYESDSVTIYLGRGDGTLGERLDMAVGMYPRNFGIADFNGDKKPDIAVVDHSFRTGFNSTTLGVSVLINDAQ